MPNVMQVLKAEISRLARKEARAVAGPARKAGAQLRRTVAELRRSIARLERGNKSLAAQIKACAQQPVAAPGQGDKARVTAKGMRSLRRKLRLTQAEFGALIGVSGQAVLNWEKKTGALRVRQTTRGAILAIRGLGAKEARRQVEAKAQAKAAKRAGARRRRKRG